MTTEIFKLVENFALESIDSTYSYSGKLPGAGYHRNLNSLHTAIYSVDSFVGSIKLQATLAIDPADNDWFDIAGTEIGMGSDSSLWTDSKSVNFSGNFVWIRAAYNLQNGTILSIRYNY